MLIQEKQRIKEIVHVRKEVACLKNEAECLRKEAVLKIEKALKLAQRLDGEHIQEESMKIQVRWNEIDENLKMVAVEQNRLDKLLQDDMNNNKFVKA